MRLVYQCLIFVRSWVYSMTVMFLMVDYMVLGIWLIHIFLFHSLFFHSLLSLLLPFLTCSISLFHTFLSNSISLHLPFWLAPSLCSLPSSLPLSPPPFLTCSLSLYPFILSPSISLLPYGLGPSSLPPSSPPPFCGSWSQGWSHASMRYGFKWGCLSSEAWVDVPGETMYPVPSASDSCPFPLCVLLCFRAPLCYLETESRSTRPTATKEGSFSSRSLQVLKNMKHLQ